MSRAQEPVLISKTTTDTEDRYIVTWDYGKAGTTRVRVYIPPRSGTGCQESGAAEPCAGPVWI